MLKKFLTAITITLALNFLAIVGAVGWLHHAGHLDTQRLHAIREILFPEPVPEAVLESPPEPRAVSTTQPMIRLEDLLAGAAGRSSTEQVQFLQHAFDAQVAQLDRRQRELNDLQRQVDLAKQQLARDRQALEIQQQALEARLQEADRLAADKGFQDSLRLYLSMPSRQVKSIFMTLDDAAVRNYLQAMPPRTAARIIKEFKTPDEMQRIQRVLEDIRLADVSEEGH